MQYVLMIYGSEATVAGFSQEEMGSYMQEYAAFHQGVVENGMRTGGAPLQPTHTATTVRVRDGEAMITDGPFAETKEQLAGFYVLECKDLDEAIEMAKQMPDVRFGSVEIRPVFDKY